MSKTTFKKYSLFTVLFTLFVILWGAYVRLSHSGDGCGQSWPLCKGQLFPTQFYMWVEWLHRFTSALSIVFIVLLAMLASKIYPKKHFYQTFRTISCCFYFHRSVSRGCIGFIKVNGK